MFFFFGFLGWGETESTWYVGHCLVYCTSPGWQMMMDVKQSVEWELAGETEVLGENLPQCPLVHHKFHMTLPGLELGPPSWEAGDQRPELWRVQSRHVSWKTNFPEVSSNYSNTCGARGNVVGCCFMLQPGRSRVWFLIRSFDFSIDLILPGGTR
jgi:hypothetical protein